MRSICFLMALSIFTVSCENGIQSTLSQKECNDQTSINCNPTVFNENVVQKFFNLAETMDESNDEDYSKLQDFTNVMFGEENDKALEFVQTFETESERYKDEGFDLYVQNTEIFSESLSSELIDFKVSLEDFVLTKLPTLEEYKTFIAVHKAETLRSELCNEEKKVFQDYLTLNLGYAQYVYQNFYKQDFSNTDQLVTRDGCDNFWKKLLCGSLGAIVGTVTAGALIWIMSVIPMSVSIIYAAGSVLPSGQIAMSDTKVVVTEDLIKACPECALLMAAVLGIYVGVKMYKWCCSWFDEDDDQVCEGPDGSYWVETDCDGFKYNVYGPSSYGTTIWTNNNTDPSDIITPSPRIAFKVPNYGEVSQMIADISCVQNSSTMYQYHWAEEVTFISDYDLFPLEWDASPPSTFSYTLDEEDYFDNSFNVSVNTQSNNVFEYDWNVNSPHEIVNGGGINDNWAEIWVATQNTDVTISCNVENVCLNESDAIAGTTLIQ